MYSCGPPLMDVQVWDDQHELTYSSYVRTRVVILKTCRRRWVIGRNGERRSGISAQAARHDDDDDDTKNSTIYNKEISSHLLFMYSFCISCYPCIFTIKFAQNMWLIHHELFFDLFCIRKRYSANHHAFLYNFIFFILGRNIQSKISTK